MTVLEWVSKVDNIRTQYIEGAITAREYFNAVMFHAVNVETPEEEEAKKK